jgi:hypothetical protein
MDALTEIVERLLLMECAFLELEKVEEASNVRGLINQLQLTLQGGDAQGMPRSSRSIISMALTSSSFLSTC